MKTFFECMKKEIEEKRIPPANKNQNLKELTPKLMQKVQGASPLAKGGHPVELSSDSWPKLKQTARISGVLKRSSQFI